MKQNDAHTFSVENFEGPLEFLLHLIQKNEIDIYEVSIKKITDQFLAKLSEITFDSGAEFIGTAASLLLLKSKMLLPAHESEGMIEGEEDGPKYNIIEQLIEYCRFKDAAKILGEREFKQSGCYTRGMSSLIEPTKGFGMDHLTLNDLATLFQKMLLEATPRMGQIHGDEWSVSDKMIYLRKKIVQEKQISFVALFLDLCKEEMIVTFLAMLELMKLGELSVLRKDSEMVLTKM